MKIIQDRLLGIHSLVKDFEGNTNDLSIDVKNFQDELVDLDEAKIVEFPG